MLPCGGLFSVALSVGLLRLDVIQHLALWSPDFPRMVYTTRGRLTNEERDTEDTLFVSGFLLFRFSVTDQLVNVLPRQAGNLRRQLGRCAWR
jgi:hypothetical protein